MDKNEKWNENEIRIWISYLDSTLRTGFFAIEIHFWILSFTAKFQKLIEHTLGLLAVVRR